ncbi:hypothetical protein AB1K89_07020 [Sporosarcina sp. 179-K 8C2 HS]|uniref:hypothetical protein n=1 Tax=Sporosarcina sp. 179-K 8C2 HS TaxID=3142387 RepID=UPI0039A01F45
MVLAKAEVIENMEEAVKLGREIERVESALKAMKAQLKAFVDINGPVDTGDVIWDYTVSASWQFDEKGLKELAQNMVLEGVNPWKMLNITASNLKKMGWDDAVIAKMGEKKETRRFSSRKK